MLKQLILENTQGHKYLELNLKPGLNVIHGRTASGKSIIIRALKWWAFDDFSSDELRRFDTKETKVTGVFENSLAITRIKSNTVNAYEVIFPDGKKTRYDAIGKSIPEDVQKLLGMYLFEVDGIKTNLNIAEQFSSPFLLSKEYASTFRAKLFNQLTGHDLQDKLFKSLNKDLLGFSRDISIAEKQTEELTKESEVLKAEAVKLEEVFDDLTNRCVYIEDLNTIKETYLSLNKRLTENRSVVDEANNAVNRIKIPPDDALSIIKSKIDRLNTLKPLLDRLLSIEESRTAAEANLLKIVKLPYDFASFRGRIEALSVLKSLADRISQLNVLFNNSEASLALIKVPALHFEAQYVILEQMGKLKKIESDLKAWEFLMTPTLARVYSLDKEIEKNEAELNELKKLFTVCEVPGCGRILEKK